MSEWIQKLRDNTQAFSWHDRQEVAFELELISSQLREAREQLVSVRNAGNQALRQWKMYADMTDSAEDFEKSAEGSVYRACKALLIDDQRGGK